MSVVASQAVCICKKISQTWCVDTLPTVPDTPSDLENVKSEGQTVVDSDGATEVFTMDSPAQKRASDGVCTMVLKMTPSMNQ